MGRATRPVGLALMALLAVSLLPSLVACGPKGPVPQRDDAAVVLAANGALGESGVRAEVVSYKLHSTYWPNENSSREHNVQEYVVRYSEPESGLYRENSVIVRPAADPEHRLTGLEDYRAVPAGTMAPLCVAFAKAAGAGADGGGFLPSVDAEGMPEGWYQLACSGKTPNPIEPVSVAYAPVGSPAEVHVGVYGYAMSEAETAWKGEGQFPALAWARWASEASRMTASSSAVLDGAGFNRADYESMLARWLAYSEGTVALEARETETASGGRFLTVGTPRGTYLFSTQGDDQRTRVRKPGGPTPPGGERFDYGSPGRDLESEAKAAEADWQDGKKR